MQAPTDRAALDFKQAGHIVDDEMHDILVKPLPPGCRLTAIFDACHSATALDLPCAYTNAQPRLMRQTSTRPRA